MTSTVPVGTAVVFVVSADVVEHNDLVAEVRSKLSGRIVVWDRVKTLQRDFHGISKGVYLVDVPLKSIAAWRDVAERHPDSAFANAQMIFWDLTNTLHAPSFTHIKRCRDQTVAQFVDALT